MEKNREVKPNSETCCLYFKVNALSRKVNQLAEEGFAPLGLSPSHGFLLMCILKTPGQCQSDLCKEMQLQPSTMTRFIEKLVYMGMIKKELSGRNATIYPSEKAEAFRLQLETAAQALHIRFAEMIGENFSTQLICDLCRANSRISQ